MLICRIIYKTPKDWFKNEPIFWCFIFISKNIFTMCNFNDRINKKIFLKNIPKRARHFEKKV